MKNILIILFLYIGLPVLILRVFIYFVFETGEEKDPVLYKEYHERTYEDWKKVADIKAANFLELVEDDDSSDRMTIHWVNDYVDLQPFFGQII